MSDGAGAEVIDLDAARRVWATSRARCGACGRRWIAVWAAGKGEKDYGWECPGCGQMTGLEIERWAGEG